MDKYAIRMEICPIDKIRFMITISEQLVIYFILHSVDAGFFFAGQ
jgi:hypothetical protein